MEYELALIDKAAEMCGGSYYKLSKAWGVPQSRISEYRHGKARVPLNRVPKLAVLAGVDPQEAYLRVSIEQMPEGSEERDLLGNVQATIVVALLLLCVIPGLLLPSQSYANAPNNVAKLHIVECVAARLRSMFKRMGRLRSLNIPLWALKYRSVVTPG